MDDLIGTIPDAIVEPLRALKPRLRGWLHAAMAPLVVVAGAILIWLAPTEPARVGAIVFSVVGLLLFTTSAVFHLGNWQGRTHATLQRLDHSNIYLVIAGSCTPIAISSLSPRTAAMVVTATWIAALAGSAFRVFWLSAPRALNTCLYIGLGWGIAPFTGDLFHASPPAAFLTLAGGVLYTVGGLVYGFRRPDPFPAWFGYHEVFHAFTIVAWACHYAAISVLTYR